MRLDIRVLVAGIMIAGCSGGGGDDGGDDGFETLLEYSWEVPPGEVYYCVRQTITEDITLDAIEAIAPPGTHHTVVSWGDPDGPDGRPDGVQECTSYDHHFDAWLFESSDKPQRYEFPPGFGHRIPAGNQISLNFHILNSGDNTISGTTGTRIRRVDPSLVDTWATVIFMGKVSLSVPPGESDQTGQCEIPADMTLMAINPHMHSHATHQKVVAHSSVAGDQTLLDSPFSFDTDMFFREIDPDVEVKTGDIVDVTCSYNNDSGGILPWGQDSWTAEMCWSLMMVYPADAVGSPACAN